MHLYPTEIYSKERLIIKTTAFFWLFSKVISWKLWLSTRLFPIIPPFDCTPILSNEIHFFLFAAAAIGLLYALLFVPNKKLIGFILVIELFSCFLDQMRWQPWEYQYLLVFLFFVCYKKNTSQFLELVTFLIGITYFFSGLHKFNGGFLYSVWENMILRNFFNAEQPFISKIWVHYAGLLLAVSETVIGLGLLFLKNKKVVAYYVITMHVALLLILLRTNHNTVVWPWNVAMILYAYILFVWKNPVQLESGFCKNNFNLAVFLLIVVLPFFSFFGYWDNYLAFNLYSGNTKTLLICSNDFKTNDDLKPFLSSKKRRLYCKDSNVIYANEWALKELKVPIYPEQKTFTKLKKVWNALHPHQKNTFICYWYPYKTENFVEIK